jgi:glycosyltransferase involved in cell wall biosynthesis
MNKTYNPLDIARAIPLVLAEIPTAHFAIQTYNQDPQVFSQFRSIIMAAGAESSVTYISDLADDRAIAACYSSADLALSIPGSDGTPISVLEAMSCAVPVIGYDIPAARPWIHDGETGMLVPLGDVPALASAISRLLSDHQLRSQMGEKARRLILENVDTRVCMDRYEEIYRRLASGQPVK